MPHGWAKPISAISAISAGPKIHYLKDIKTISAAPLRSLRLCVRIIMPHGKLKSVRSVRSVFE